MSGPVVTFVYADWAAAFPPFQNIGAPLAQQFFNQATFICANDACNELNSVTGMLQQALWLLTAHIAWLQAPRDANGQPSSSGTVSPIVGRVSQASEGSVSVSTDMGDANAGSPSQAWFMQTQWGSTYWTMTMGIRTARYVPAPYPAFPYGPVYTGRGIRRGGW